MGWKPQNYTSKNTLKTTSVGSLRMPKRRYESDEADDEASEDCRPGIFVLKEKKCKSLHEELRTRKVQFDIPLFSKKNTKAHASGQESPVKLDSDRPSTGKDNPTSVKRDSSKKRSESPPPIKNRAREFNLQEDLQDYSSKFIELPCVSHTPYQVGLVSPTTSEFQEKRVQFDLRKFPRCGKGLKNEKSFWKDIERDEPVSSDIESRCPLNKPTLRTERSKSAKESMKYVEEICDKKKEEEDKKIEVHSSASSIFRERKFRPKEYVSGGWRIRLDPSGIDCRERKMTASVVTDLCHKKESLCEANNFCPSREQDKTRRRCRDKGQRLGRDRPSSASENPFRENRNKVEPAPFSSWKCPLRRTCVSAENSPHESLVKFDDPRMWRRKECSKRDVHCRDFQCSHEVTKKSSSLTQNDSRDSDFPICTINETTDGKSVRTKLQFPVKLTDNRNDDARATVEFSHAQSLDMYSTDTDTTDVNQRSHSCPLRRKVRRTADGISASMRQECVETESQIHFKIESEIKIDIPNKGKDKFSIDGEEKKPIGILRNNKKVQFGEENDNPTKSAESIPKIIVRPSLSVESCPSKTGFVASLVSEDIVFPERERSPPVAQVKLWIEPESSDSPVYQTVSPCCESSTSMEGNVVRKRRHEHFGNRNPVKKKEDASSGLKADAKSNSEANHERKARGKDLLRETSPRKPPHRKVESAENADLNEHRNFGFRGGNVKGEMKVPKLTFPPHPLVESKFIAKKREVEKREMECRVESTRSESSIASSSSCYHSNVNLRSPKPLEEKKPFFGYGPKFLRQTMKETRYESKYLFGPSSSIETPDELASAFDSTPTSISVRKYKPLLRDVLRYLPPTQIPPPPDLNDKVQGADPIITKESTLDRLNHALGRDDPEKSKPNRKESNVSQELQLRGVSIGSSVSWCGPQGSLTAMTKSLLYVDNQVDSHSEVSSGSSSMTPSSAAGRTHEMKMEKALKKSVTSGSFTSAHSKMSSSPEETYESCSCPRLIGCADKRRLTVASQTHITALEVQDNRSIINFLDTAWELKKFLHEKK